MKGQVIKGICFTEKSAAIGASANQYIFDVDVRSSKQEIARFVEDHFGVTVLAVNTIRRDGKMRRNRMKRGAYGVTPKRKLAIVKIKKDEKIEII